MCYVITDNNYYIGTDFARRPCATNAKERAMSFKTKDAAENFISCLPGVIRHYKWSVLNLDDGGGMEMQDINFCSDPIITTDLEREDFDILGFFTEAVSVISQLDRFVSNMTSKEQLTDMKILDVRHYIRNNNHRLSAIQMQRLGYYLQSLEKERYEYKSKRIIASMFVNNMTALKDRNSINKMNDVLESKYHPRVLEDNDIEYIINKKKEDLPA